MNCFDTNIIKFSRTTSFYCVFEVFIKKRLLAIKKRKVTIKNDSPIKNDRIEEKKNIHVWRNNCVKELIFAKFFKNVGVNVDVNVDVNLNEIERKIIGLVLNDLTLTAEKISGHIEKLKRTAERYLKALQEKGYIERIGTDKKGNWKVIK